MTDIDWSDCPLSSAIRERWAGFQRFARGGFPPIPSSKNHDDGVSAPEIAEMFEVPLADVEALLAYAEQARDRTHEHLVR